MVISPSSRNMASCGSNMLTLHKIPHRNVRVGVESYFAMEVFFILACRSPMLQNLNQPRPLTYLPLRLYYYLLPQQDSTASFQQTPPHYYKINVEYIQPDE